MLVPVGKLGNPLIEQRGRKKKISKWSQSKIKFDPDEKVSMEKGFGAGSNVAAIYILKYLDIR